MQLGDQGQDNCLVLNDSSFFAEDFVSNAGSRDTLQALEKERLFCNRKKCQFGLSQVKFLGHVATGYSLSPDPEKLQAAANWPIPKSVTDIRLFLGFTNFFRRFIQGYSSVSRPLEVLTGKNAVFSWNTEHQGAFEKLRKALLRTAPVLQIADTSRSFRVVSDAIDNAINIGGVATAG